MRPIGYPETSVRNYHYPLRNNPEEHNPHNGINFFVHSLNLIKANLGTMMELLFDPVQEQETFLFPGTSRQVVGLP
jgi:hypothetical protein